MLAGATYRHTSHGEAAHFIDVLRLRASAQRDRAAYRYLRKNKVASSVTYGELDSQVRSIAGFLQREGLAGERAVLFYETGIDYIAALFGCFYASVIAIPLYAPRRKPSLNHVSSICANAQPRAVLSTSLLTGVIRPLAAGYPGLAGLRWLATDTIPDTPWTEPAIDGRTPALLQYTSGATGDPRGVIVTHENLLCNQQAIQEAFGVTEESVVVSWLPLYHDMGLIGGVLHPVFTGAVCMLLPSAAFLQRPLTWLQAISLHGGTVSGGPNFAYDLCVDKIKPEDREGLDLSRWTIAFNGAEPVRAETLDRFARAYEPHGFRMESFRPCYGLAEATLLVTGKPERGGPTVCHVSRQSLAAGEVVEADQENADAARQVACGSGHSDSVIAIVDPEDCRELAVGRIGEIWVSGPSVAAGYWNRPEETRQIFQAALEGSARGPFLRTGDLGFMRANELYISGRLKDLIVIHGRNIYPQDVERMVEQSHSALRRNAGAAFSVDLDGRERLIVVQEIHRSYSKEDLEQAVQAIRSNVADALEIAIHSVVLLKSGGTPKTTSGKVRRDACRTAFLNGTLDALGRWDLAGSGSAGLRSVAAVAADVSKLRGDGVVQWLRAYAGERINSRLIDERRCIPPHIVLDFGNRGILGLQVPELYGGIALRNADAVRVIEQLGAIDLTLALFVGNHNALGIRPLIQYGTAKVRDEWVPMLAQGRELAAFALTEPGAGSNPRAISAKATRDSKGGWRLSGTKQWIGSGSWAGVITVFVQLTDEPTHPGRIAAFALRQGTKGLRQGPEGLTMGMRGMVQNAIYLNDVLVSEDNLLGEPGAGLDVAQDAMMFGRLGLAATAVGGMKRCAQLMLRYARRRSISSGRLIENPVTLARFTDLTASAAAVEALVTGTAEVLDEDLRVPDEVFVACKIAGAEYLWRAADDLVQLLGGRGYMESNIAAQILRDARVFRIFEGPTETLQAFLGANIVRGSADFDLFLRDRLNAADIVARLQSSAEIVQAHYADRAGSFQDRASMLRWVHFAAGKMACSAIVLAFVRRAASRSPSAHLARVSAWAEWQFERDVAAAIEPGRALLFGPQDVVDVVGSYIDSIGDIEQTCAGEDHALDWLLRPDVPAAEKQPAPLLAPAPKMPQPKRLKGPPVSEPIRAATEATGRQRDIEKWLREWLIREAKIPAEMIQVSKPFADFGLDSTTAIMLMADLEEFVGDRFETTLAWDFPTISSLAGFIASRSSAKGLREDGRAPKEHDDESGAEAL
jgi:acyl-CoA synthetase (AMP-forming)/AMP-acid ligase II/alkylation response protein AidB-like acyl-CoA dehydrogenase/acyl carrier protein